MNLLGGEVWLPGEGRNQLVEASLQPEPPFNNPLGELPHPQAGESGRAPQGAAPTVNAGKWGTLALGMEAPRAGRDNAQVLPLVGLSLTIRDAVSGTERNKITPGFSEKERGETLIFLVVMGVREASMARERAHFCRLGVRSWRAWRAGGG